MRIEGNHGLMAPKKTRIGINDVHLICCACCTCVMRCRSIVVVLWLWSRRHGSHRKGPRAEKSKLFGEDVAPAHLRMMD